MQYCEKKKDLEQLSRGDHVCLVVLNLFFFPRNIAGAKYTKLDSKELIFRGNRLGILADSMSCIFICALHKAPGLS